MEKERMNVAEILRHCLAGMNLDCVCFENVVFDRVDDKNRIRCFVGSQRDEVSFNEYGCLNFSPSAKCVIFPEGKNSWEGFVPLCKFKDGDVVFTALCNIAIISDKVSKGIYNTYCAAFECGIFTIDNMCVRPIRLATEEEKQELFTVIKNNGYKWNSETKTLAKLPKFKVGDRIRYKRGNRAKLNIECINIKEEFYQTSGNGRTYFKFQDDWELVPNKFDITTLKPLDKVLVRQSDFDVWGIQFFGGCYKGYYHGTGSSVYNQCIPYEQNKHLLGTADNCDEFYNNWQV